VISGAPPEWLVDAARLNRVLSELRVALPKSVKTHGGEWHEALLGDRAGLAERFEAFVTTLRCLDRSSALHQGTALAYSAVGEEHLATVLRTLSRAARDRVATMLGSAKLQSLRDLLADPFPDLLGLTGRTSDENAHSCALAWLLDVRRAPTIAPRALQAMSAFLEDPLEWRRRLAKATDLGTVSIRREVMMGRESNDRDACDRIDLLISGPDFVIAIENKIWSQEHDNQTTTYSYWLEELPRETLSAGLFLTPDGYPAGCPTFKPVSYLELLGCLLEASVSGELPNAERSVLAGYVKTLASEILRNESRVARSLEDVE
jgi:hypothetical protein